MCPHSVPCNHLKGYSRQFCLEAVFASSSVAEHMPEPPCSRVRAEGLGSSQCGGVMGATSCLTSILEDALGSPSLALVTQGSFPRQMRTTQPT